MDIAYYQGYEIQAAPRKLADGEKWEINIAILKHSESGTKIQNFFTADAHDTRKEAVRQCFQFGKQISDGLAPACTVADM